MDAKDLAHARRRRRSGGSKKGLAKARCVRKKMANGMGKLKARKACGVKGSRRR